ncbi:MAG: hypothetical protein MSH22_10745 [Spirochaetia bacterium]|nr:hypothetical protein [Spirochaetia bacterium]
MKKRFIVKCQLKSEKVISAQVKSSDIANAKVAVRNAYPSCKIISITEK